MGDDIQVVESHVEIQILKKQIDELTTQVQRLTQVVFGNPSLVEGNVDTGANTEEDDDAEDIAIFERRRAAHKLHGNGEFIIPNR